MREQRQSTLRRVTAVGAALAVVVVTSPVAAASAAPRGVHCGMKITRNFILRKNLHNCGGDGLVVRRSNITISLRGHTIDGRGRRASAGIRVTGVHGVTIRGGVIRQFGRGIWLVRANGNQVRGNVITGNVDEGLFTNETSSGLLILGNRISGSGVRSGATWADGIDARGDRLTIRDNVVAHNHDDGIDANGDGDNIDHNGVDSNGQDGIDVDGHNTVIQRNTATRNGDDGIGVGAKGLNVTIKNNTTNRNFDLGIQPISGTAVDGGGNTASDNGDTRECVRVRCT
jgi:parallel beta-helix repeat protein